MRYAKSITFALITAALLLAVYGSGSASGPLSASPTPAGRPPREITGKSEPAGDSAYLALRVEDLESAERQARRTASEYGGYVSDSQSWQEGKFDNRILVLKVPGAHFERVVARLKGIGELESEYITPGAWHGGRYESGQVPMAAVTVHLLAERTFWSAVELPGWHPGETLANAFSVFVKIFGFAVDVLIWVLVVLGPFALIGYTGWRLSSVFRKNRQAENEISTHQKENEDE